MPTIHKPEQLGLREKQYLFLKCFAELIEFFRSQPKIMGTYELTGGDLWSKPEYKAHKLPNSAHYNRLAIDLNLFDDGVYVTGRHPVFGMLGDYWKSLHPLCRWGGDFASKDFNHFSIEHNGVA